MPKSGRRVREARHPTLMCGDYSKSRGEFQALFLARWDGTRGWGAGSITQRREVAKGPWRLGALARGMIFPLRRHVGNHEEHEGHEGISDFGLRIWNRQGRGGRGARRHHAKARSRKGALAAWRLGALARGMIFPLRRHVGNHEEHEGHEGISDCGLRIWNRQGRQERPPRRVNCVRGARRHRAKSRTHTWRLGALARGMIFRLRRHVGNHEEHEGHEGIAD
jgi:hypothetical protein